MRSVGARSCEYVPVDPVEAVAVTGHATHQGAAFALHPNGISGVAQALLWPAFLGVGVYLDNIGECDGRDYNAVHGITFRKMMLPTSAGSFSFPFSLFFWR